MNSHQKVPTSQAVAKVALRRKIEASLNRLEHQLLITRNGDQYVFLTNEEKEIENAILYAFEKFGCFFVFVFL